MVRARAKRRAREKERDVLEFNKATYTLTLTATKATMGTNTTIKSNFQFVSSSWERDCEKAKGGGGASRENICARMHHGLLCTRVHLADLCALARLLAAECLHVDLVVFGNLRR